MKKIILLPLVVFLLSSFYTTAQDFFVPDSILKEVSVEKFISSNKQDSIAFLVTYPENYNPTATYPVLLGLSGGGQSMPIVQYCYAAWFRSNYFRNYIGVFPINTKNKNLRDYSEKEVMEVIASIKNYFSTSESDWIISGTSNGGLAAFNFIAAQPNLFEGAIVIPGSLPQNIELTKSWSHLKIVMAYGSKDAEDWINGTKQSKLLLEEHIDKVHTIILEDQEHILPINFDLDFVYEVYFEQL